MHKELILDSCVIIDFFNDTPNSLDIEALIVQNACAVSFVTKLEALSSSNLSAEEEFGIRRFLSRIPILPTNDAIEEEAIKIRRGTNLKLPDAIIAATAVVIGAEIVTTDNDFLKCPYAVLRVWQNDY
jgi:predicted nucleic acid-binding protein